MESKKFKIYFFPNFPEYGIREKKTGKYWLVPVLSLPSFNLLAGMNESQFDSAIQNTLKKQGASA